MTRVLISGITGHVGRELSAQLRRAGAEVHGLTRQRCELSAASGLLHHVDGGTETVVKIFKNVKPDLVVHLAAMFRGEHDSAHVVPFVEANIQYGTQLLEAMRVSGCSRIVTAGSYLQHASTGNYRALNLYAATKQAFESLLEYYADAFGFAAVRLTLGNIYSEHETRRSLMRDIVTAWTEQSALVLTNPEVKVDLIHVEDVARAFVQVAGMLAGNNALEGRLSSFSVTSGTDVSALELVGIFEKLAGRSLLVKQGDHGRVSRRHSPWRGPVVPGWTPRIPLENGIARILEQCGQARTRTNEEHVRTGSW